MEKGYNSVLLILKEVFRDFLDGQMSNRHFLGNVIFFLGLSFKLDVHRYPLAAITPDSKIVR